MVGVELSETAVQELFEDLSLNPKVTEIKDFKIYSADRIHIFVGDFFNLSYNLLAQVDAIYDRAALVALPEEMRKEYSSYLMEITNTAPQLLIVFDYDQNVVSGPPFSISEKEIKQHYGTSYSVELLESVDMNGGLKGQVEANENVWTLISK